jgi:endonuclease-3
LKYPTLEALNDAEISDIERIVHPCGLFKTKAKDIKLIAKSLLEDFGGEVPNSIEDLLTLSGVGRKTANLIMGDIFGKDSVVCDTHCIRITNRMGLINTTDPYKAEMALREILDLKRSGDFCHRLVLFGREICSARSPKCDVCPFECKIKKG